VRFARKITVAERMLARACQAAVPARWVVADSFTGRSGPFRRWLEERDQSDAVMIPRTKVIANQGGRLRVERRAARLSERASAAWLCLALSEACAASMGRGLLIHRAADDPSDDAYWLAYGPAETTKEEVVRVCDARWQGEECFAQAKGEVGMDPYEVRTWTAWHRFVTLGLLAHASRAVVRHAAHREEGREQGAMIPACSRSPCRRRADWSARWQETKRAAPTAWRGRGGDAHQAVAARCHAARRAVRQEQGAAVRAVPPLPLAHRVLSDTEWARIRPLLPRP